MLSVGGFLAPAVVVMSVGLLVTRLMPLAGQRFEAVSTSLDSGDLADLPLLPTFAGVIVGLVAFGVAGILVGSAWISPGADAVARQ